MNKSFIFFMFILFLIPVASAIETERVRSLNFNIFEYEEPYKLIPKAYDYNWDLKQGWVEFEFSIDCFHSLAKRNH